MLAPTPRRGNQSASPTTGLIFGQTLAPDWLTHFKMAATSAAAGLLSRQLKQMQSDKDIPGISCGLVGNSIFEWEVMLMINDDCRYYGGEETSFRKV